ncbi:hypothetical protein DLAC_02671 [Tieghemostelium lacteum]|uniref:Uncharacterized protein n=1 Tax=Tieghemostelium lacteum TaxID=361077 RepID=A0A152A301_TIELA|nr:hypothetical protein DLAC_02671 [Tieghemostelium lacteum]|eukprot:KYR00642.1 hypothetical protein DLAC_02671 [Tieghemostelium lacteum]
MARSSGGTPKKPTTKEEFKELVRENSIQKINHELQEDKARESVIVNQKESGKIPTRSSTASEMQKKLTELEKEGQVRKRKPSTKKDKKTDDSDVTFDQDTITEKTTKKKTTPKKKYNTQAQNSDTETEEENYDSDTSSSSSISTTQKSDSSIGSPLIGTKKYSEKEMLIIQQENRVVMIKFILFTILMFTVPFLTYYLFYDYGADYFGINRDDRVVYGGVLSVFSLLAVMASYSIMAYYEK